MDPQQKSVMELNPGEIIQFDFRSKNQVNLAKGVYMKQISHPLKMITWNIERGIKLKDIILQLRDIDADIIALQEIDSGCSRSGFFDTGLEIAKALELNYAFQLEFKELGSGDKGQDPYMDGVHGNGVLTKFDIEKTYAINHKHQPYDWNNDGDKFNEPRIGHRCTLCAVVKVPAIYSLQYLQAFPPSLITSKSPQITPRHFHVAVYTCHMELFCGISDRLRILSDIFRHSELLTQSDVLYQAIMGDFNTLAHSIARFSPNYCKDPLRLGSLTWTEGEWWTSHVLDCYMDTALEMALSNECNLPELLAERDSVVKSMGAIINKQNEVEGEKSKKKEKGKNKDKNAKSEKNKANIVEIDDDGNILPHSHSEKCNHHHHDIPSETDNTIDSHSHSHSLTDAHSHSDDSSDVESEITALRTRFLTVTASLRKLVKNYSLDSLLKRQGIHLEPEVLQNLVNPGFMEVFPSTTETLTNYNGWFYGKLDWMLTKGFACVDHAIYNQDYSASDHRSMYVACFLDERRLFTGRGLYDYSMNDIVHAHDVTMMIKMAVRDGLDVSNLNLSGGVVSVGKLKNMNSVLDLLTGAKREDVENVISQKNHTLGVVSYGYYSPDSDAQSLDESPTDSKKSSENGKKSKGKEEGTTNAFNIVSTIDILLPNDNPNQLLYSTPVLSTPIVASDSTLTEFQSVALPPSLVSTNRGRMVKYCILDDCVYGSKDKQGIVNMVKRIFTPFTTNVVLALIFLLCAIDLLVTAYSRA